MVLTIEPDPPSPILGITLTAKLCRVLPQLEITTLVLTGKTTEAEFHILSNWLQTQFHPTLKSLVINNPGFNIDTTEVQKQLYAIHTQAPFTYIFKINEEEVIYTIPDLPSLR